MAHSPDHLKLITLYKSYSNHEAFALIRKNYEDALVSLRNASFLLLAHPELVEDEKMLDFMDKWEEKLDIIESDFNEYKERNDDGGSSEYTRGSNPK